MFDFLIKDGKPFIPSTADEAKPLLDEVKKYIENLSDSSQRTKAQEVRDALEAYIFDLKAIEETLIAFIEGRLDEKTFTNSLSRWIGALFSDMTNFDRMAREMLGEYGAEDTH